jgi:Uma2 family endonuclease
MLVREMTSPGYADICQRLGVERGIYARTTGYPNRILQNALFDLAPPGATQRVTFAPDVSILRATTPLSWAVPRDNPLLAVEVVSESPTIAEIEQKAQVYRDAGVDEVWIVDHKSRSVALWNAAGATLLGDIQTLNSALLPGLAVAVRYLLDG